ncbi:MAG: formate--tetrahydrofolate ligase, partial [Defluviitaleaceae bacterium]|nr:formate--tetrahydrofolate ligase [Defluviitaleaceae bacterium]
AMAALLKDAIKPNLVQTIENSLAIIHGGPFANIAHGCNSVAATKLALKLGDICITEAGFGADLGAEKFMNIKCRKAGLSPDCAVLVATIRSLKYNGGGALEKGMANLERHIANLKIFGVPVIVALNAFDDDTAAERQMVADACQKMEAEYALSEVWGRGGEGGIPLVERVLHILENQPAKFSFLYNDEMPPRDKITKICKDIYGANAVQFSRRARNALRRIRRLKLEHLPICMAKNQYSFSDNPALLGAPEGFDITIREIQISAGAGFLVAVCGDIMTMPGLPKTPAAEKIDVDAAGNIRGLF